MAIYSHDFYGLVFLVGVQMNKLIYDKPAFVPYDICLVVGTNEYVLVTEVNCNTSQVADRYQWSYSVSLINRNCGLKNAWYETSELTRVNNVFEIIAEESAHPFGSKKYKFNLGELRRSDK
jgi:hypothetical protein